MQAMNVDKAMKNLQSKPYLVILNSGEAISRAFSIVPRAAGAMVCFSVETKGGEVDFVEATIAIATADGMTQPRRKNVGFQCTKMPRKHRKAGQNVSLRA